MNLNVKKLNKNAAIPARANKTDAGADIVTPTDLRIKAKESAFVDTGIAMEIPDGYYGLVTGRSGLTKKKDLFCAPGIIDAGYRGSIGLKFFNFSDSDIELKAGERIAQILIMPIMLCGFIETDSLSDAPRGTNGFGSTGTSQYDLSKSDND